MLELALPLALLLVATPPQASPERAAEPAPGLLLALHARGFGGSDARVSRLLALHVPANAPASPFLQPGPFRATWRGFLDVAQRDRFTFAFEGSGRFELEIDGKNVLDVPARTAARTGAPVRLKQGRFALLARYESPAEGDATVRVTWAGSGQVAEPLPPTALSHDPNAGDDAALLRANAPVRRGRELFAELRCARCHDPRVPANTGMPELAARAPSFAGIGSRLSQAWMARWIADPAAARAQATMPQVFSGEDRARDANDVAAWLATLGANEPSPAVAGGEPEQGARLYASLGCAACHDALPLRHVHAKYRPGALRDYLRSPQRHWAWTPMPDFALSDAEATALAAYLRSSAGPGEAKPASGDAARGRELAERSGCFACHEGPGENRHAAPKLAALASWTRGCLATADEARGRAPRFALDDDEREALRAFRGASGTLARDVPAEAAERQLRALRCTACHARDAARAEFAMPEAPPALTWAGEKLRADYVARLVGGEVAHRARPWLALRMPAFPARAETIAAGLAMQHGFAPRDEPRGAADPQLAAVGGKLVAAGTGFTCVQCHGVGEAPPTQVFDVQGVNFARVAERLRPEWFLRWMLDPPRIDPATKMPKYADDQGRTAFTEHFGGDARRQFAAIWEWICSKGVGSRFPSGGR